MKDNTITPWSGSEAIAMAGVKQSVKPGQFGKLKEEAEEVLGGWDPTLEISNVPNTVYGKKSSHAAETMTETTKFASLSPEQKKFAVDTLNQLNQNGRLYVEAEGKLKRSSPAEAASLLDKGQPVVLVDRIGEQNTYTETKSENFELNASCLIIVDSVSAARKKSEHANLTQDVRYTTSQLTDWSYLSLVDPGLQGVKGAPFVPKSGGTVTTSVDWEKEWLNISLSSIDVLGGMAAAGASGSVEQGYIISKGNPSR
ncbi:MAG: hypothetical protein HYU64_01525 [Armatimonadetes bacterium]|nr:hypothetical protein [Armatimonadota bacterium]